MRIKINNIKEYFRFDKNIDPLTSMYMQLVVDTNSEEAVLNGLRPDVSKVSINRNYYNNEVKPILRKYALKTYPYLSDDKVISAIAMYDLDIGPRTCEDIEPGYIVIQDDWLIGE